MTQDNRLRAALAKVDEYREKLKDRGVYPDRFARWVATWPSNKHLDVVRTFAGELPGIMGSAPGTPEEALLEASRMTREEILLHKKSKERPK